MKRLCPRTLFSPTRSSSPSPCSIFIAHCSTSSPSPPPASVFWDFENCNVAAGLDASLVIKALRDAAKSVGIVSGLEILGYGDVRQIARIRRTELAISDVNLRQVPKGKESADKALIVGLMEWVSANPAPANIIMITGDGDFAPVLHKLRLRNYNVHLVSKEESVHYVLCSAATVMWCWNDFLRLETNSAKFINQPPDDLGYRQYEGPLEDRFTLIDRPAFSMDLNELHRDELLSQDIFWKDVEIFMKTAMGSWIIAESRNRGNMAYYLHTYGPPVINSLKKEDVCHLVHMLILDKKLVTESFSGITPSGDDQYRFRVASESSIYGCSSRQPR